MNKDGLMAAIVSAALIIGLLSGLTLGYIARNYAAPDRPKATLPQQR